MHFKRQYKQYKAWEYQLFRTYSHLQQNPFVDFEMHERCPPEAEWQLEGLQHGLRSREQSVLKLEGDPISNSNFQIPRTDNRRLY